MHSGYYGKRKQNKMDIFLDVLSRLIIVSFGASIIFTLLHSIVFWYLLGHLVFAVIIAWALNRIF